MKLIILGGGLSAISLAYFLQDSPKITSIEILEKESEPGGLCRSFTHDGLTVDIGPHIMFSKDKETLGFILDILGENRHELRRSNRILHKGRRVQYPFENDLSQLPKEDCEACVRGFLHNPYRDYPAENMLQFFLKTFGEGITNLYLRPYNEKIWKFDPAFIDTQMVERIPRPPDEDILRSAAGETVDGYTHQLYFSYPKEGGMAAFIAAFVAKLNSKVTIRTSREVTEVRRTGGVKACAYDLGRSENSWEVTVKNETYSSDMIVSCMPLNELVKVYSKIATNDEGAKANETANAKIASHGANLKYNHILIAAATLENDRAGDNFAFMCADKDVPFHRVSKLDFLGKNYHKPGTATLMLEYTYRDGDPLEGWSDERVREEFTRGLRALGFVESEQEVLSFTVRRFPYAYVIYDLAHRENTAALREYFAKEGVFLNGRFGNFEYWNMDRVVERSRALADNLLAELV